MSKGLFDFEEKDIIIPRETGLKCDNILALDIATTTGWCNSISSGVWCFDAKKDESKGMRLLRFSGKLKEMHSIQKIDLIVFEGAVSYGKFPNFVGTEMIGVCKLFCESNDIEYKAYMPTQIKKFATGKGNANKDLMVRQAKKQYPDIEIIDHNHADAIYLYQLAKHDLGL